MTKFIINADDFGINLSATKAVNEAMKSGLITDTTMVANGEDEAFDLAVKLATQSPEFRGRVGVHLNLTEGKPLTKGILNCPNFVKDGVFHGKIKRLRPLSKKEKSAIYDELTAQVLRLRENGIIISHADSHHHIHGSIFIAPIALKVCMENGIEKMRIHRNIGKISPLKKLVKNFYNRYVTKHFLTTKYFGSAEDLNCVFPNNGVTEIMTHPDFNKEGQLVDRVEFENDFPVGQLLEQAVKNFIQDRTNYENL